MPNKTIYISDSDLPIFEKAQAMYGGNLSSTIVNVLRTHLAGEAAADEDETAMHDIVVKVGVKDCFIQQRFKGRILAKWKINGSDDKTSSNVTLFETQKGRYALYTMSRTNWENFDWSHHDWGHDDLSHRNWKRAFEGIIGRDGPLGNSEYRLDVYETFDELKEKVPKDIIGIIEKKISGVDVEDLDI